MNDVSSKQEKNKAKVEITKKSKFKRSQTIFVIRVYNKIFKFQDKTTKSYTYKTIKINKNCLSITFLPYTSQWRSGMF